MIMLFLFIQILPGQVNYTPVTGLGWKTSTPEKQGLDPDLVRDLYDDGATLENLYGLIIVKNGYLVAEKYFNGITIDQKTRVQSVTKSFTSTLFGLALEKGCLENVDQKMLDFFPELVDKITDPRKKEITVRHLLQMRAGYPWEETDTVLWNGLLSGRYIPYIERFPLVNDPGTGFNYSNLSSNWLGIILARSCVKDLESFARENLFLPLGIESSIWEKDWDGYNMGCCNLHLTTRDMARFGMLYLNKGNYNGRQIIPAAWVNASLENYSEDAWITMHRENKAGLYFRELGYGYQWWSATVGNYRFDFAWGHGGQLIILLDELDMVIVTKADPQFMKTGDESWIPEQRIFNLAGRFILSLSHPDQMPPKKGIHDAAAQGDLEAIQQHIRAGSDLDEKDPFGSTPLIIATTFGRDDVASALINAGAAINIKNNDGSTALIAAAFLCRTEIVRNLLEKGADKNIRNNTGASALDGVIGSFESVRPIYEQIEKTLGPLGLKLDLEQIKQTRPEIAAMLREQ